MDFQSLISDKLAEIGGTCLTTRAPSPEPAAMAAAIEQIEALYQLPLPAAYRFFYTTYGACSFNASIESKAIHQVPIACEKNKVDVGFFYSLVPGTPYAVHAFLSTYPEFTEQALLPICEGSPGDSICLHLPTGQLYYWDHEGVEYDNVYLVAQDFADFVQRWEIEQREPHEPAVLVKSTQSQKMLDRLKAHGYGPRDESGINPK